MKHLVLILLLLISASLPFYAQTNFSGIINSYDQVTAYSQFNNSMDVVTPAMWTPGDRVVVIQITGATINTSNNSNFGSVTSLNNTGNYELATICEVNRNTVVFDNVLSNAYSPTIGKVQLVKIAVAAGNVLIQDTVRALAWNGNIGGVVAIEAAGTVTVDRPIIVDGQGFRGGTYQNSTSNNCFGFFNNEVIKTFFNSKKKLRYL
jgi:hypothetical protein